MKSPKHQTALTIVRRLWRPEEHARLLAACAEEQGQIAGIPAGDWWLALHSVLFDTGERISTLLELTWSDIDLIDGWLIIPAAACKGKTGDKAHKLHAKTVVALRSISGPSRGRVFPWPFRQTLLWGNYTRIVKRAGLRSKSHKAAVESKGREAIAPARRRSGKGGVK